MTSQQLSDESTRMLDGSLPATSTSSLDEKGDDDDSNRILKRGDLARIVCRHRKPGKLKDHNGDLGRILRSIPVNEDDENNDSNDRTTSCRPQHHPFLYDVELILGGRLTNVERCDLQYTTAFNEGMTGDSRQQRKRRQSQIQEESNTADTSRGKKKQVVIKKTNPGVEAIATNLSTDAKKRNTTSGGTVTAKSSKKLKQSQSVEVSNTSIIASATNTNGTDPFERHRRELERCMVRLEKVDAYCFFTDEVPVEFQENYHRASVSTTIDSVNDDNATTTVGNQQSELSTMDEAATTALPNVTSKGDDPLIFPDRPPFNLVVLRQRMEHGRYILNREQFEVEERINLMTPYWKSIRREIPTGNSLFEKKLQNFPVKYTQAINWELYRNDVIGMCDAAVERNPDSGDSSGTIGNAAMKIRDLMEQIFEKTGKKQELELELLNDRHRFTTAMEAHVNMEAAMQGKWKKDAFAEREYERLRTDAVCAGLSKLDERIATYELKTSLEDKFIGLSYTYDDTGQSEGWMKSMLDEADDKNAEESAALALSSDDGVNKAQVAASMQTLLIAVQDRVMTDLGVLKQPELRSANWECGPNKTVESSNSATAEIVEQPVWGMDCYTRRNISTCLETEFDSDSVLTFVEKWLLPAVNACPADLAYNLANAARILEGLPFDSSSSLHQEKGTKPDDWSETLLGKALVRKIHESGPPWLRSAAQLLRRSIISLGHDFFRIHPKGHGSIVLCSKIPPNRLVTFYRGEVYPSWRWGEKMDAISLIQKRKGLKPRLPDFFNMALERPQSDPRGYGRLYVDASRKSGYGSMLSHSCKPSCEVRVAAINGKLVLAMTTLREMTIGDEVTFDYNAVTESLHEYQTAVCLCGHGQCRGSFLHFATADCYQQVLNRNSPVAVRLAQLIKGCTKKVMAEEDDRILKRHGFQTAAFGAISVNRREAIDSDITTAAIDSMEFVPIWLRTFVADILRYIEYERRALPIALICNQISNASEDSMGSDCNAGKEQFGGAKDEQTKRKKQTIPADEPEWVPPPPAEKAIKGSKPEPTFFYFSRIRREHFLSMLMDEDAKSTMTGTELEREVKKRASLEWKTFSPEVKQHWKEQAFEEWEKNGGKEKARLEELRQKKVAEAMKSCDTDSELIKVSETEVTAQQGDDSITKNKISFQAADAEGISAMEQRIQQLTQALSRVGRVLDRHREERMRELETMFSSHRKSLDSFADLRESAHSPLSIMPDEDVVAWMWNHSEGVVRTLFTMIDDEICVSPSMKLALKETESKYSALAEFGTPWIEGCSSSKFALSPSEGRTMLNDALLDFRSILLDGIEVMAADIKKQRKQNMAAREVAKKKEEQTKEIDKISKDSSEHAIRYAVKYVLNDILDIVEGSAKNPKSQDNERLSHGENDEISEPWLQNYNKRFKIEKAADLLLLYARTSTFFRIKPYEPLQSTPIEVYARELGNSVPRSVMDKSRVLATEKCDSVSFHEVSQLSQSLIGSKENHDDNVSVSSNYVSVSSNQTGGDDPLQGSKKLKVCGFCEPEDIVSEVVVDYQGDYVLSQLLQWYNAGIEQKPGLPDLLGCALLPSMSGCWTIDYTKVSNASTGKWTGYRHNIRPRLIDWLQDPYKRGNPWTDELRRGFVEKSQEMPIDDTSNLWLPIGSPVMDFLVTGDDFNIMDLLYELGSNSGATESEASGGLLSSIDHGRPAQAVSNWVQCENPDCLKWRKIPWHVDVDMLSMKFVCSDNVWNEKSASCDAPEDEWDETADACVEADGSVKPLEIVKDIKPRESDDVIPSSEPASKLADFRVGARFDVLRSAKNVWSTATIVDVDFVGMTKRIKFHYPRLQTKHDEWLEVDSPRISPLYTHTSHPQQRATNIKSLQSKDATTKINDSKKPEIQVPPSLENSMNPLSPVKESKATRLKRLKELKRANTFASSLEPSSCKVDLQVDQLDVESEDDDFQVDVDDSSTAPLCIPLPQAFEAAEDEDSDRGSPSSDTFAKNLPKAKESKATRLKKLKQLKKSKATKSSRNLSSRNVQSQRGHLYDTSDDEEWSGDTVGGASKADSFYPKPRARDEGEDEESEHESIDPRTTAVAVTLDEHRGNSVSNKMVESTLPVVTDHSSPDGSPKREGDGVIVHGSPVKNQGPAVTDSSSPSFKIPKKKQQSSESISLIARKPKVAGPVSLISNVEKPADIRKPTKIPGLFEKPMKLISQGKEMAAEKNQRNAQQHGRSPSERSPFSPASANEMAPGLRAPLARSRLDFTSEQRSAPNPSRPEPWNTPERNLSRREPLLISRNPKSIKPGELHLSDASGRSKYSWVDDSPVADGTNDSRDRWSEAPMQPPPRLSHSPIQGRDRRMHSDNQGYVDRGMHSIGRGHVDRGMHSTGQGYFDRGMHGGGQGYDYHENIDIDHNSRNHDTRVDEERSYGQKSEYTIHNSPRKSYSGRRHEDDGGIARVREELFEPENHSRDGDSMKGGSGRDCEWRHNPQHEDGEEMEHPTFSHRPREDGMDDDRISSGYSQQYGDYNNHQVRDHHGHRGDSIGRTSEREYNDDVKGRERRWREDEYDMYGRGDAGYEEYHRERERDYSRDYSARSYSGDRSPTREDDRRRHRDSKRRKESKSRRSFDGKDEYSRRMEDYHHQANRSVELDARPHDDDRCEALPRDRHSRHRHDRRSPSPRKSRRHDY